MTYTTTIYQECKAVITFILLSGFIINRTTKKSLIQTNISKFVDQKKGDVQEILIRKLHFKTRKKKKSMSKLLEPPSKDNLKKQSKTIVRSQLLGPQLAFSNYY